LINFTVKLSDNLKIIKKMSLIDSLKSFVTPELISQAAGMLGESETSTAKGMGAAVPAILSGLLQKGSNTSGAGEILDLIKGGGHDGGILSNLGGLFGGDSNMLSAGSGILGSIFGDKIGSIASVISSVTGMGSGSSSSLLSMAAPLVMGVLGKKVASEGLSASGLMNLFSSEKDSITSALPAGLGSVLGLGGLGGLGNLGSGIGNMADKAKSTVSAAKSTATNYAQEAVEETTGGGSKWLWPLVLLAVVGGLLWYFMKGCKNESGVGAAADSLATAVVATTDSAASSVTAAVDSAAGQASSAVAGLGSFFKRKLADGSELNVPENGIESKLIAFIEDKAKAIDKTTWFSFDRLYFETGKSILKAESQEQLKNIAAIMKAYPEVNIKLGGYTDNTGSAAGNMKLSGNRAANTVKELVALGVDAKRLTAEGYGSANPVASNDTPEGRAQNRRIDVLVTKK
jgi:OmpA-OmpF porin, OOP family